MVRYELPKLAYDYDELEPYIDATTMKIHHQKHHQYYTDGLNSALENIGSASHPQYISSILSDLNTIPESGRDDIRFFGGGFENHRLFWETLTPNAEKIPDKKFKDVIDIYYNNWDNFKKIFSDKALSIEGSGWCWLVFNPTYHRIEILTTQNQDSPWMFQRTPLLGLDMWEHAYYLRYQNSRSSYIESWWNVINWDYVLHKYSELAG